MERRFTVEEAYTIGLSFFLDLWPQIEPVTLTFDEHAEVSHELFFTSSCWYDETSAQWNRAVFRVTKVPKGNQRELTMPWETMFLCTVEFCKVLSELYDWDLNYTLQLLDSMQKEPEKHAKEWGIWRNVMRGIVTGRYTLFNLDWFDRMPQRTVRSGER